MKFKVGDVVQLKSGGPKMTVQRIIGDPNATAPIRAFDYALKQGGYEDGDVACQWFQNDRSKSGVFKVEMLVFADGQVL